MISDLKKKKSPASSTAFKGGKLLTNWMFFSGYQSEIYSFTLAREFNTVNCYHLSLGFLSACVMQQLYRPTVFLV